MGGSAANTAVGAPVYAVDPDGDPVTYSRDGADMGHFVLNTVSGQVWTASILPAHRESLALTLWADDGRGGTDRIDVTVFVKQRIRKPEPTEAPTPLFLRAATPTPAPTPAPAPTRTPSPTSTIAPTPTPTPSPTPTLTPTPEAEYLALALDARPTTLPWSGTGRGRTRPLQTPGPTIGISVIDIGQRRVTDEKPVVIAAALPIPSDPWWPRFFLWLGSLGLLFALAWLLLMAARDRRRAKRKDAVARNPLTR